MLRFFKTLQALLDLTTLPCNQGLQEHPSIMQLALLLLFLQTLMVQMTQWSLNSTPMNLGKKVQHLRALALMKRIYKAYRFLDLHKEPIIVSFDGRPTLVSFWMSWYPLASIEISRLDFTLFKPLLLINMLRKKQLFYSV
jgi:flagellar biosynthesis protein FlhB